MRKSIICFLFLFLGLFAGCMSLEKKDQYSYEKPREEIIKIIIVDEEKESNDVAVESEERSTETVEHLEYKEPSEYNVKLVCYDENILNPENDRRSYYRIFLDKLELGRTETALESQYKTCTFKTTVNRHLLSLEKWVLDEEQGKYVKVNNIEQPKPNYLYFEIPENRILIIQMIYDVKEHHTLFKQGFEVED